MVDEAGLERTDAGLAPSSEGWFVVNVAEAVWITNERYGTACVFEGDAASFRDIGYTLAVLEPGQPSGMYHREANQEDFLVLAGECLLIIEEQERRLRAGDFVHCPGDTEHIFVGAGSGACVIFMIGARCGWPDKGIVYPRSETALRHRAGVEHETTAPVDAYADAPEWYPGRPAQGNELPWRQP